MNHDIDGVIETRIEVHADERGSFAEIMRATGFPEAFAQANHSVSKAGVLRGLHYHVRQADLWYVISGRAQVALADLRTSQERRVRTLDLSCDSPQTLFIPKGVAHGFFARTDVDLIYWVTHEYDPQDEHGIAWNDPFLAIPWQTSDPILSARDSANQSLEWTTIPRF
ncbi:MAG: dTDP-4-dehydrorhamnose 3,5-epimerase [Actinomycetota bacterium]|nr:dTDP-4-dehydrorhamnose 3,5-epimerase [Actinomycetota bacterium]